MGSGVRGGPRHYRASDQCFGWLDHALSGGADGQVDWDPRCPRVCQTRQARPVKLARMFAMSVGCLTSDGRA